MLPDFDENGNLPPGIYRCTIEEVAARFGSGSPERETEIAELRRCVQWAKDAGIIRLIVDGSFTTAKAEPNDVDLVILLDPSFDKTQLDLLGLERLWPFLHVIIAGDEADLESWASADFAFDREDNPRGVLEIVL